MSQPAGALSRCVAEPEAFLRDGFGRHVLYTRGADPAGFADLLSLDDVDRLVTSSGLRAPAFRLVEGGSPLPASAFLRSARIGSRPVNDLVDAGKAYAAFAGGATMVLQGLQRYWPPLMAFCRELELALGHAVQANAYITPPTSSGLRVHADAHDVFALQTAGRKQWVVYEAGDGGGEPALDVHLEPGDALYLPEGTRHAARTVDEPSAHVTIGIRPATWAGVLRRLADEVASAPEFAERLPAGWPGRPEESAAAAGAMLARFAKQVGGCDAREVFVAERRRFTSGRQPHLRGMLADLLALEEIDDGTEVRRRRGSVCDLTDAGERLHVTLGDRVLDMPAAVAPAMRRVAALPPGGTLRPADLAGDLDAAGRVVLVRRLVREGLLLREGLPLREAGGGA